MEGAPAPSRFLFNKLEVEMAKAAAMKNRGDALVLQVNRDEPVNVKIGGKGVFLVALQTEVGSPGSGAWRDIETWSRREADEGEIEYFYQNSEEDMQNLRLVVKEADDKSSISVSMEVPAEEEPEVEEPKLRERREAEFAPGMTEAEVAEADEAEKAARTTTTTGPRPV